MRSSARAALLLILTALALAALFAILAPSPRDRGGAATRSASDGGYTPAEIARAGNVERRIPPTVAEIARGGVLRGKILIDRGQPELPGGAIVRLRPSRFMMGKDSAASRDLEVKGDRTFAVEGIPFGSYEVRAVAKGLNGIPSEVQLGPLQPQTYATIRCIPAAKVIGHVRDSTRAPVEQLRIELSGVDELGEKVSRVARSTADGSFLIEEVLDGQYALAAGSEGSPLRPPLQVTVSRGETPFISLEVPALAALDVTVVGAGTDTPLEGFVVTAASAADPRVIESAVTSANGVAPFRNLLPGKYAILAARDYFKRASAVIEVEAGKLQTTTLSCVPLVEGIVPERR